MPVPPNRPCALRVCCFTSSGIITPEGIILAAGLGGMGSVFGAPALGIGAGLLGLVFMVIIGGVIGFIGGIIVAIVYNIVLGAMGGIEMDLEAKV